jgi:N-acetylmuramoyl-L-alanine amidase
MIVQGDSVIRLSDDYGFDADTIWNDAANAALKEKRKDMNELVPGDEVVIPDRRQKIVEATTGTVHRFRRNGIPAYFRLQVFDGEQLRANQPFTLTIKGRTYSGTTDDKGVLELYVPATADEGTLVIGPDELTVVIDFGHLDPITEISGVQKRLNNLGYFAGESGELDDATRDALADFQYEFGLDETAEPDEATIAKLSEVHDKAGTFTGAGAVE